MKLTPLEFVRVMSTALYVFTGKDDINLKELLSYIKEDAKLMVRRRSKDAK